jgi:cytochrome c55X
MPFIASFLLASASHLAMADISTERQSELIYLLKQDCGSCHGMTLKGGLGPALLPETLKGKPNELLVTTILEGRTGTAMPPWKSMLTRDEAEWITVHLQQGVR